MMEVTKEMKSSPPPPAEEAKALSAVAPAEETKSPTTAVQAIVYKEVKLNVRTYH